MKKIISTISIIAIATSLQAQTIANGNMEAWTTLTSTIALERPNNWWGLDKVLYDLDPLLMIAGIDITPQKQVYKTTDKFEGDFAAKLLTMDYGDTVGMVPAIMANANMTINMTALATYLSGSTTSIASLIKMTGGTPMLGKRVDSITFYARTAATNGEDAAVAITAYKKLTIDGVDTLFPIGSGGLLLPPSVSGYTKVSVPMYYVSDDSTATDTLRIMYFSSVSTDTMTPMTLENSLFVDDIQVYSSPGSWLGINELENTNLGFSIFPNPTTDYIFITQERSADNIMLSIVDINGRVVFQSPITEERNRINTSDFASGVYYYQIIDTENRLQQTGSFVKQ